LRQSFDLFTTRVKGGKDERGKDKVTAQEEERQV